MPSFQLFEINENFSLEKMQNEDILNKAKTNEDDPQTLKTFLESAKKHYKNLSFEKINQRSAIKMIVDEYMQFQDDQSLWITREKMIIKYNQLLLIGKAEKKIERLLQIYLRDSASSKLLFFTEKQLWQIWKKMRVLANSKNLEIKLHRLILKRTYIDSDKINELNVHANDVSELGIIEDIVRLSDQVKAITIKIKGFYEKNKWFTIRIDKNGSLLIYGNHDSDKIIEFLKLLVESTLK